MDPGSRGVGVPELAAAMDGTADAVRVGGADAAPNKGDRTDAVATGFSCVGDAFSTGEVPLDDGVVLCCGDPVAAMGAAGVSVDESTAGFFVSL